MARRGLGGPSPAGCVSLYNATRQSKALTPDARDERSWFRKPQWQWAIAAAGAREPRAYVVLGQSRGVRLARDSRARAAGGVRPLLDLCGPRLRAAQCRRFQ